MKKKQYIQPQAHVVELNMQQCLMAGSPLGATMYTDPADDSGDL